MPMLPANDVRIVRPFLVKRFFSESEKEVANDMEGFLIFLLFSELEVYFFISSFISVSLKGLLSSFITPSSTFIIRDEYCSANSGLCVTIITRRSLATFFNISIT